MTLAKLKMSQALKPKQFQLMDAMPSHPNKIPFKCALFEIDKPSDGSPEGANGKKIRISSAVCDANLQTFVGMGFNIDYYNGMSGHDPRFKVGVIEKAYRTMDSKAMVEGYIYGKNFPDVIATIRYYNGLADEYGWDEYRFGASLEMEASVMNAPDDDNLLDVTEFCGTGGAILFAQDAAFKHTSFVARNKKTKDGDLDMTPEQIKAMEDAMKATQAAAASIGESLKSVLASVDGLKADVTALKAAADKPADPNAKPQENAELKAAQDKLTALEKELADLKAAAAEPQRKTASPAQLLAKHAKAGNVGEDDAKDYASFCAAIDRLNLSNHESMKLKIEAKAKFHMNKEGE